MKNKGKIFTKLSNGGKVTVEIKIEQGDWNVYPSLQEAGVHEIGDTIFLSSMNYTARGLESREFELEYVPGEGNFDKVVFVNEHAFGVVNYPPSGAYVFDTRFSGGVAYPTTEKVLGSFEGLTIIGIITPPPHLPVLGEYAHVKNSEIEGVVLCNAKATQYKYGWRYSHTQNGSTKRGPVKFIPEEDFKILFGKGSETFWQVQRFIDYNRLGDEQGLEFIQTWENHFGREYYNSLPKERASEKVLLLFNAKGWQFRD